MKDAAIAPNDEARKGLRKIHRLIKQERIDEAWQVFEKFDSKFLETIDIDLHDKILQARQIILKRMINELKVK